MRVSDSSGPARTNATVTRVHRIHGRTSGSRGTAADATGPAGPLKVQMQDRQKGAAGDEHEPSFGAPTAPGLAGGKRRRTAPASPSTGDLTLPATPSRLIYQTL